MFFVILVVIITMALIFRAAGSTKNHNEIDDGGLSRNSNTRDYNTRNSNMHKVGNNSNHNQSQPFHDPIKSGFDYEKDYEKLYEQDTDVLLDTILKTGGTRALDTFLDDLSSQPFLHVR